jgi:hypothetical protein
MARFQLELIYLYYILDGTTVENKGKLILTIKVLYLIIEEGRSAFKIFTGKSIGKRFLGKPRYRWKKILE